LKGSYVIKPSTTQNVIVPFQLFRHKYHFSYLPTKNNSIYVTKVCDWMSLSCKNIRVTVSNILHIATNSNVQQ